ELPTSRETGWASRRASAAIACAAPPSSARASSPVSGPAARPAGRPDRGLWSSFTVRSAAQVTTVARAMRAKSSAAATGTMSRLPTDTMRRSARTTAGLHPAALSSGPSVGPGAPRGAPGGAEDLGDAAEGERVLQVPGVARLEEGAPGEQRAEATDRRGRARVRPDLGDHRMEDAEVARERLEVEGGGDVGFAEQPFGRE